MMERTRWPGLGLASVTALVLAAFAGGCASSKAFQDGETALAQGNFDAAVADFQQAHQLDPNSREAFEALCRSTEQAVAWHRDQARAQLDAAMLGPARSHIDKTLEYCGSDDRPIPGRPTAEVSTACGVPKDAHHQPHTLNGAISVDEAAVTSLHARIAAALRDAKARADTGEQELNQGLWDKAVATLRDAVAADESSQRAAQLLESATEGAVRQHLALADDHLAAEQWQECERECALIASLDPANREAQQLQNLAEQHQQARTLQQRAQQSVASERFVEAIDELTRAASLWPDEPSIASDLAETRDVAANALLQTGRQFVEQGSFGDGLKTLDDALAVANRADIQAAVSQAESAWAAALVAEAEDAFNRGEEESAWAKAAQAVGISPNSNDARVAFERFASAIRDSLAGSIAVIPSSVGNSDRPETARACAMMVNAIRGMAPSHLKLVERMNLKDILAEQDLAAAGLLGPDALKRIAGRLGNADQLLLVTTSTRSSDAQKIEDWNTVSYIAGTKLAPNPAYADAQEELQQAQKALQNARVGAVGMAVLGEALSSGDRRDRDDRDGRDRRSGRDRGRDGRRIDRRGDPHNRGNNGGRLVGDAATGLGEANARSAQDRYNAALLRIQQTPQLIPIPDERDYKFPVLRVTRTATVTVEMRLVDVATGQVIWDEAGLSYALDQSDTYVKPEPQYGVPEKQALLPLPEQLYSEAVEKLGPQLTAAAQDLMSRRSDAYLMRANRTAYDAERLEWYVRFLFDPGPSPDPQAIKNSLNAVLIAGAELRPARLERAAEFAAERLGLPG